MEGFEKQTHCKMLLGLLSQEADIVLILAEIERDKKVNGKDGYVSVSELWPKLERRTKSLSYANVALRCRHLVGQGLLLSLHGSGNASKLCLSEGTKRVLGELEAIAGESL